MPGSDSGTGTTIFGFADSKKKITKILMPTDPRFFLHVTINTHIFFFGPYSDLNCEKKVKIKRNTRSEKKDS